MKTPYQKGTLLKFSSGGSTYTGFVIGTCSYDNAGEDNAYVIRYVFVDESPRKPYTIVAMDEVELVRKFPANFHVGGDWSATPEDRCKEWKLLKDKHLLVVPCESKMVKENPG